jgi:hypothetical protein
MIGNLTLWLAGRLRREAVAAQTAAHLTTLVREPVRAARRKASALLAQLQREPGPKVQLGVTAWGEAVIVPLRFLVEACSVVTGGMGSGKSLFASIIIEALIRCMPELDTLSFGVIDAKGELFDRALYLLGRRLEELQDPAREALLRRIVVIDFSARDVISSYNVLVRFPHAEEDFFITSRLETLKELLPAGERLSLRGTSVLKPALALLSEFNLSVTYIGRLLSDDAFRHTLVAKTRNSEIRAFFEHHLKAESKQTLAALRVRMETLVASEGVRLALSGHTAPDFCRLQNEGAIVLINCAGPAITRGVRMLLQGLVLSDVRGAVFARPTEPPVKYLWVADEAQNFFHSAQQVEDVSDLLSMGRSFGSFFSLICQNLTTAVSDSRTLESIFTNIRWAMTFRGTPQDARFLRPALPVTGRRRRPDQHPFREPSLYSMEEERSLLQDSVGSLPDFGGYLWFKSRINEAIRITTQLPSIPRGREFEAAVSRLRTMPELGGRMSRAEYERRIEERDRAWQEQPDEGGFQERLERAYREEQRRWQT